ncbi:uncharacterized protein PHALS_14814 [Plasmopara halstedii]|uniref:Uncharacterized protein n=1 Tax=Plasmopara halstedii TaxID=4781 RepID=A0A0P1AWI6_PLAHL|nr:uncharacterized protein PHALS_14814 [Plasmopara halstedii]CEG45466.1 hypothetical protein PHALS_14814 [Plasmopara halstedii]|eukprot:XP_024581835.1 hypothetical protein PHALS_14814 [Plasmopara halstedii]
MPDEEPREDVVTRPTCRTSINWSGNLDFSSIKKTDDEEQHGALSELRTMHRGHSPFCCWVTAIETLARHV